MRLVVLGSGTGIPAGGRNASGYACIAPSGQCLLLECGPGSTRRWPQASISIENIHGQILSHHHIDHACELPALLFARRLHQGSALPKLLLAGPIGHAEHLRKLRDLYSASLPKVDESTTLVELQDGGELQWGDFRIESRELRHCEGALGFRVSCGASRLAFSGDTGPCEALVELCQGVDLALVECSYLAHRSSERHLNTTAVAELAQRAALPRLLLSHAYPGHGAESIAEELRSFGYKGALYLARDGAQFDLGDRTW